MLAACQHGAPRQGWANEPQSFAQPPDTTARPAPRQARAPVQYLPVDFYLAQDKQAKGLSRLQAGKSVLWFSPQAVMTRADLESVQPRRTAKGQPFVRFTFTQPGAKKLDEITTRYKGKVLITTVGRNIVSLLRLDASAKQGVLDILVKTDQDAVNIANAVSRPLS
jgi:hypothetical protein